MSNDIKEKTSAEKWASMTRAMEAMEAEEAAAMPIEEVDAALRAKGLDPEQVAAEGAALAAKLMAEMGIAAPPPPAAVSGPALEPDPARAPAPDRAPAAPILADADVLPFRAPPRRTLWPYYGLAAAAAILAILTIRRPPPPDEPNQLQVAAKLRDDARTQCAEGAWRTCVDTLNMARGLDRSGDERSDVQELRAAAAAALSPKPAPTPTTEPSATPKKPPTDEGKTRPKG